MIIDRFYRNRLLQFVDLISLANISILVFDEACHGYYIHGRSVHGSSDVNMDELNLNLKKEEVNPKRLNKRKILSQSVDF
jgi:meckelin